MKVETEICHIRIARPLDLPPAKPKSRHHSAVSPRGRGDFDRRLSGLRSGRGTRRSSGTRCSARVLLPVCRAPVTTTAGMTLRRFESAVPTILGRIATL